MYNGRPQKRESGTANVKYSEWFTLNAWTKSTIFNVINYSFDKSASGITNDILDKGTILVYAKLNSYKSELELNNKVVALNYNVIYEVGGKPQIDTWSFNVLQDSLKISFVNNTNNYTSPIANSQQFRYEIIPGCAANSRIAHVDYDNYEEVKKAYQIPE